MNFQRFIYSMLLILPAQLSMAQSGIVLKAAVDKNKILLGERIQLTIEATYPEDAPIKFLTLDSLAHFELLGIPKIDTINTAAGTSIKGVYQITSFDSGSWVIPSFSVAQGSKTDSIPVDVLFSDFDPNQDYHDIKDVIDVKITDKTNWWWYGAGGLLLFLILLYFLLRKKKPQSISATGILVDPYEEAMKELSLLQKQMPEVKIYHTRLIDIFRLYVYQKKGILSLQKTTADLIIQLKTIGLNKELSDSLSQSLRLSDFVKFAKYTPLQQDSLNAFDVIKKAIVEIEKQN